MVEFRLCCVNFYISECERSLRFYLDQLGLKGVTNDEGFGYASFKTSPIQIAFARA